MTRSCRIGRPSVANALATTRRLLSKAVLGPLRYGQRDGYDIERYWRDRFHRYGRSLVASGHEGRSEEVNQDEYAEASAALTDICRSADINFSSARVLEVGLGVGFYTRYLADLGVTDYIGVDVTDVLFPEFEAEWPNFRFVRADITADALNEQCDVALMIDVLQHIVNRDRLTFGLHNVVMSLRQGGRFVVGPVHSVTRRQLFYVHFWTREEIIIRLRDYAVLLTAAPFRTGEVLVFERS